MTDKTADNTYNSNAALVIRITCIAWLIAKAISWKLWLPFRVFPTIPVFDFLNSVPDIFHLIFFIGSFTALIAAVMFPSKRKVLFILLAFEILLCLFDQMRWQPWEYQYLLTLIIFCCQKKPAVFLKFLMLLMCITYIFSGLHKFTDIFLGDFWDNILLHVFHLSPEIISNKALHYAGFMIPVIECSIGIGLLLAKNKKPFALLCAMMHVSILALLGPFGLNYNEVVWPWNFVMPAIVYILFIRNQNAETLAYRHPFTAAFFAVVVILPASNFFGIWDDYLSFNLYSGGPEYLVACYDKKRSIPQLAPYETSGYCGPDKSTVSLNMMAQRELRVPLYQEDRIFKKLKQQWLAKFNRTDDTFEIHSYPYGKRDVRPVN